MQTLNEKLADVGWMNKEDWSSYSTVVFRWMEQATAEIIELRQRIEELEKENGNSNE